MISLDKRRSGITLAQAIILPPLGHQKLTVYSYDTHEITVNSEYQECKFGHGQN